MPQSQLDCESKRLLYVTKTTKEHCLFEYSVYTVSKEEHFRLLDSKQKEFKNFTQTVFAPVTEANRGVCRDIFSCIV